MARAQPEPPPRRARPGRARIQQPAGADRDRRQPLGFPLGFNDLLEFSGGSPAGNGHLHATTGLVAGRSGAAEHQHFGAEGVRDIHEISGPFAAQGRNGLFDLERIAAGASQGRSIAVSNATTGQS